MHASLPLLARCLLMARGLPPCDTQLVSEMACTVWHRRASQGIAQSIAGHHAGYQGASRRIACGITRHRRPSRDIVDHCTVHHRAWHHGAHTNIRTSMLRCTTIQVLRSTYSDNATCTHTGRLSTPSMREKLVRTHAMSNSHVPPVAAQSLVSVLDGSCLQSTYRVREYHRVR